MSKKEALRVQRQNTVINATARQQEMECIQALYIVEDRVKKKHGVMLAHYKTISLSKIVSHLQKLFPDAEYAEVLPYSSK